MVEMLSRRLLLALLAAPLAAAEPRCDLLIQGALDGELQPLLAALENRKQVRVENWTFWTGRLAGKTVVVSRTDVGPINAVMATTLGILRFRPKAVINQGTAGAHNPALKLWDIVIGERTTDYSAHKSAHGGRGAGVDPARWRPAPYRLRIDGDSLTQFDSFPGDRKLMESALRVPYSRGSVIKGNIGSAYQFNKELDLIHWFHKTYGTDSEDMESAYAAGAAAALRTPFLAIRIISDSEWNHPAFEPVAGQYCAEFVRDFVARLR
jgi:adenosylhomocysteine nucleosidase